MSGAIGCDTARDLLHPYLDGELDRAAVDELEVHLFSCAACRDELASLEHVRSQVRQAPRFRAPRRLREQLRTLDELAAPTQNQRGMQRAALWQIAASVVLAFALGT